MSDVSYVNPLAGAGTTTSNPVNLWNNNPYNTVGGRWTSARVVRCGIRVIPSSNITVKSGILTAGVLVGKTVIPINLLGDTTGFRVPTVEALR